MLRRVGFVYLLVGLLSVVLCKDVVAQDKLTQLSLNINEKLVNLKQEMLSLQDDLISTQVLLQRANSDLALSQTEREEQEAQLTKLYNSLESINEKLSDAYKTIDNYKNRLDIVQFWLMVGAIIIAIRIVSMIIGYILYFKGIRLPRWVDILL
jgi:peptidoglycan hydrolase CwlO-like protein